MSDEYSGNTPGFTLEAIPIIGSSRLGIRENTSYSGNFIQMPRFQQFLDNTGAHSLNYLRKMETTLLFIEEPALDREFQKGKSVVKYGTSGATTYHFLGLLPAQHYHTIAKKLGIPLSENKESLH